MSQKFYSNKKFYFTLGIIFVTGVILLFLLDTWIMPAYTNYGEAVTVPKVTRLPLDKAKESLSSSGLRFEVVERRSSDAFPVNYVLDQNPSATEIVKPNRKVFLTVNVVSNPTVKVPKVTNLSLRNARIQLENAGLQLGTISYESSRFKNTVLRQSLEPKKTVDKGTTVNLVVSDGLGEKMVAIPDIIGLQLTEAQQKLRQQGLLLGEIRFQPSRKTPPNVVLDYSPKADTITVGRTIQLVVSERYNTGEVEEPGGVVDSTKQKNN